MISGTDIDLVSEAVMHAMSDLGIDGWSFKEETDWPIQIVSDSEDVVLVQLYNEVRGGVIGLRVDLSNVHKQPSDVFMTTLVEEVKKR